VITPDLLLAMVALINAVGGVVALIIHALRVPYRESAAVEAVHATDAHSRALTAANGGTSSRWGQNRPPEPPSGSAQV
jgi:hypothetical protein